MRVMLGDTVEKFVGTEKYWIKAEVELDEIDLVRLLTEAGYDKGINLGSVLEDITSREVFSLLEVEAEVLLGAALVLRGGLDQETYGEAREALENRKAKTLKKLEDRLGRGAADGTGVVVRRED